MTRQQKKENQGKYYLPSPQFFQLVQNQPNVFYKKETAWGDFNGDGVLDIVVHGEGHRCGTGGTYGSSVTQDVGGHVHQNQMVW